MTVIYQLQFFKGVMLRLCLLASIFIGLQQVLFSQDPLDEFWKDVERRKAMKARPQGDVDEAYGLKLMEAVGSSLVAIRQEYVYTKKNIRLVRDVDEYYGVGYSVGIRTAQGVLAGAVVTYPWLEDDSLLVSKGYSPTLGKVTMTGMGGEKTRFVMEDPKVEILADGFLAKYATKPTSESLTEYPGPDSLGLLLLFYRDNEKDSISRRVHLFDPKWSNGMSAIDSQWLSRELIGGVWVRPIEQEGKRMALIGGILGAKEPQKFRLIKVGPDGELGSAAKEIKSDKSTEKDGTPDPEDSNRKKKDDAGGGNEDEDDAGPHAIDRLNKVNA